MRFWSCSLGIEDSSVIVSHSGLSGVGFSDGSSWYAARKGCLRASCAVMRARGLNLSSEREGEGESEGEGEGERAAGARLTARGGAEGSLAAIVSEARASSAIVSEAVASSAWVGVIGEGVGEGA